MGDPYSADRRSVDLGWTKFPGGSAVQREAFANWRAYKLRTLHDCTGCSFFEQNVAPIMRGAWNALCDACRP
eukprot:5030710-Pleurochrysis_carterae.AAC.1